MMYPVGEACYLDMDLTRRGCRDCSCRGDSAGFTLMTRRGHRVPTCFLILTLPVVLNSLLLPKNRLQLYLVDYAAHKTKSKIFADGQSKDEVMQAQTQTAELSLESALNSAVNSLESMSWRLEMCMAQLEKELDATRLALVSARSELDWTRTEIRTMNKSLTRSKWMNSELKTESTVCEEYPKKFNPWEAQLALQRCLVFMGNLRIIHELSHWTSMRRSNDAKRTAVVSSIKASPGVKTVGNGRYILVGDATTSMNGRSFIQITYRASPLGQPMGDALIIKYSPNKEAMKREYTNYQKVSIGVKSEVFVQPVEFLPVAGNEMPEMSALVMQRGVLDLKAFLPEVGGKLAGGLLLDCALTALRCVELLHSVNLVWNDLKTENFVVINDSRGGLLFRGIDLESCMMLRTTPVDYTPEACPPEFAMAFLKGGAKSFTLDYSYDIWSFGMFLYEISTGQGFFDGMSAQNITTTLPNFIPNLEKVAHDPALSDLISQCLSRDPMDRPSIAQICDHPFFYV